eukprot:114286-Chlamydomonas_euryale.AAC.8
MSSTFAQHARPETCVRSSRNRAPTCFWLLRNLRAHTPLPTSRQARRPPSFWCARAPPLRPARGGGRAATPRAWRGTHRTAAYAAIPALAPRGRGANVCRDCTIQLIGGGLSVTS